MFNLLKFGVTCESLGYQVNELLVEVAGSDNKAAFAHYNQFGIGSSLEGYHLKTVNGFSGSASNPLVYHAGAKFTTKDRDQDSLPKANAAVTYSKWSNNF